MTSKKLSGSKIFALSRFGRSRFGQSFIIACLIGTGPAVFARAPSATSDEARIERLLGQMTLKEKVSMVSGNDPRTNPVPRLGIPSIVMNDGPLGVRAGHNTAFPSGLTLAASFDSRVAADEGHAIADEAKLKGINMMLGPCVGLARQPFGGRNFESFGEDPFLSSILAANYITGMQSNGVIATVKHFIANDQEVERKTISSNMSERTLFETQLPMFEAAVKAGVWSVMSAYNRIDGIYASENRYLLRTILKDLWGFKGFVVSDWVSTHSTVNLAKNGLDLEMPSGQFFGAKLLAETEVHPELVASIDDKVRRLLRAMLAMGLFDKKNNQVKALGPESRAHQVLAQTIAEEGTVLLKNDGVLPLEHVETVAVIGPHSSHLRTGGGGSSKVIPFEAISPLEALRSLKLFQVNAAEGLTIEGDVGERITSTNFKNGRIKAEYFRSLDDFKKKPFLVRTEKSIALSTDPKLDDQYGVRLSGELIAPVSGAYTFSAANSHTTRVWLNGQLLFSNSASGDANVDEKALTLEQGHSYQFVIETGRGDDDTGQELEVGWRIPNPHAFADAVQAAKNSDVAVLFLGLGNEMESEGLDRQSLALPKDQLQLLNAVAAINPNTVVVLTGGGVITMPWLSKVRAVLHAWYPGSEGGRAIARLLVGQANPSGKLPISLIKRWEDSSAYGNYPGEGGVVDYKEGIFVGYRYLDQNRIAPQFPFGFGLSYTSFAIQNLNVRLNDASIANPHVTVTFDVSNTGTRQGAEVAQIYVSEKNPSVPRPPRELKNFARVDLKPGETKAVQLELDRRAFAYYDEDRHAWMVNPHAFEISVGTSSRDLIETQVIQLQK